MITAAARRSMLPHEHGAWGQLAMPLLTAFAIGGPSPAAVALAAAVVLAFLAHEPAIVLLGQRGRRARDEDGDRARRWLVATGGLAVLAGGAGVALAPPVARLALIVPGALGVAVLALLLARREKTVAGETAVAAALAAAGAAVALAGGADPADALVAAIVWTLGFAAATLAVQVILVRVRSKGARDPGRRHALLAALLAAAAVGLSLAGLPAALAWATLPTAVLSIAVCLARFSPRRLRELGWALVASSTLTLVILVVGLR
ncbi:MAG TPA: YwiC-like family protein [Anaeromyxobacter sp.]|nr:YwiC-like family protein [Anaeromyxobacter sp.]